MRWGALKGPDRVVSQEISSPQDAVNENALHRPRVGGSNEWVAKTFTRTTRFINPIAAQSLLPLTQGQWRAWKKHGDGE